MFKAAVIVTINNEYALTENFFSWIIKLLPENFQIVAVIDGTTDMATHHFLNQFSKVHSRITIQALAENLGYSKANNLAVKYSDAEYLIFLNSDTFPTETSLENLIFYLDKHKETGVVQGMILSPQNNKVQSTGHIFAFYKTAHAFDGRDMNDPVVNKEYERQALGSGFYAVSTKNFKLFNGFDEIYYNAWEGLEFSLKIHCSGLKCMYIPTARAYHVKGSGRGRIFRDETYQSAYFWGKWAQKIKMDIDELFIEQIAVYNLNNPYFGVNCSSYRDDIWKFILEKTPLQCPHFYNVSRALLSNRVSFEDSIPNSIIQSQNSILFTADDFSIILNNHRFFNYRDNAQDIILDLHGNVICPQIFYQIRGSK